MMRLHFMDGVHCIMSSVAAADAVGLVCLHAGRPSCITSVASSMFTGGRRLWTYFLTMFCISHWGFVALRLWWVRNCAVGEAGRQAPGGVESGSSDRRCACLGPLPTSFLPCVVLLLCRYQGAGAVWDIWSRDALQCLDSYMASDAHRFMHQ
jgi:hypothetical protein